MTLDLDARHHLDRARQELMIAAQAGTLMTMLIHAELGMRHGWRAMAASMRAGSTRRELPD